LGQYERKEDEVLDWFDLCMEINEAFLRSECDGDGCREELMLSCRGSELNELLIGKNHIFNPLSKWDTQGRVECRFRIWMRRRSRRSEKAIEATGLVGDTVGELQFWPEQDALDAKIFVEDEMFERWSIAFLSMRHKISAEITIAPDQNFSDRRTVGDESQITWNTAPDVTVSKARIRRWEESASKSPYK
jgi:hypothetical protein